MKRDPPKTADLPVFPCLETGLLFRVSEALSPKTLHSGTYIQPLPRLRIHWREVLMCLGHCGWLLQDSRRDFGEGHLFHRRVGKVGVSWKWVFARNGVLWKFKLAFGLSEEEALYKTKGSQNEKCSYISTHLIRKASLLGPVLETTESCK